MKTKKILQAGAAFAAAILIHHNLSAQGTDPWITVDEFEFVLGGSSGDIGVDPSGSILYSVGSAGLDPQGDRAGAVVRTSLDKGANWTILHTYDPAGWSTTHFRGVATSANPDSSVRIYAAGHLYDKVTRNEVWMVQEAPAGDQSWQTTDLFQKTLGGLASCGDIKVSASGSVYAVGFAGDSVNDNSWTVRRRGPAEAVFTTLEMVGSGTTEARGVAFHPTAGVFVAGYLGNIWTVRRSSDGVSWTTVDSFKEGPGLFSYAESIAVDNTTIYVAGRAQQVIKKGNRLVTNWVVRRSTDGGTTWTVVDRYGALAQGILTAAAITVNPGGVFVGGYTPDSWLVRKGVPGVNGNMVWVTSDQYQLSAGQPARVNGMTSDQDGSVYAAGRGATAPGSYAIGQVYRWITRKLP